jgi:hypothetical protein
MIVAIDTTELEEAQGTPEAPDDQNDTPDDQDGQDDGTEQSDSTGRALVRGPIRLPGIRTTFTPTAAIIPENLSWDGWSRSFAGANNIADMSKWWRGDLLRFAMDNEKYEQKYSQFLEGENYGSLKNLMSICGKFAPEQRREKLTFTHHVAVAPLMPDHADVAEDILNQAERENWAVADVRAAVREYLEGPAQEDDDEPTPISGSRRATTVPSEPVGVQPVALEDIPAGTEYYECPNGSCADVGFLEPVEHCLDCGAHFSPDLDACPHCPEQAGETLADPAAVSGTVITPADQDVAPDEEDEGDTTAPHGLSFADVLGTVPYLVNLDAHLVASNLSGLTVTRTVALYEWLGKVVDSLPKPAGKPLMPVPKPAGKKRGRPSKRDKAAATAATED